MPMDWDALFEDPVNCLEDPAEDVVRFATETLAAREDVRTILDVGFGAGRHAIYLARLGYEVHGVDLSPTGTRVTGERARRAGLSPVLALADMRHLPYDDAVFDAVVCRAVISHAELDGVRDAIREAARVVRAGGLYFCTFISTESSLMGKGQRIDHLTWICDDPMEDGVTHHFMTRQSVLHETRPYFVPLRLIHEVHGGEIDTGRPYVSAEWVFEGTRIPSPS